ncbi:MAG: hypothetical protein ACKOZY_05795, partial [Flavobacteriales bacterium]
MNRFILPFLVVALFWSQIARSQTSNSFAISDWQSIDYQGQNWSLSTALAADHVVLISFFNTADLTSWDFYQSGILQELNATWGLEAGGNVEFIMVESNPLNNTLQLSGPALISGNDSTQTWGDWVSENPTRLFDDAAWADSLS